MGNISIAKCETSDEYMSTNGLEALKEIRSKIEGANMLSVLISAIPFFDIFLNPSKPHVKLLDAADYDWQEFSRVMRAIPDINKRQIWEIASRAGIESSGKESEFWRCVRDATR